MGNTHDQSPTMPEMELDNPIGVVEEFTISQDWNSERTNEYELWAEMPGQWGTQRLWVAFHDDSGFLQFNVYMNLKIPLRFMGVTAQTITLINERVWLGHFEIWSEERTPVFRIVLPLRGTELQPEQLEDVIEAIEEETERFHPALQWVIWGGKTPEEAIAAALVDTEGEA
ncbi:MAG: YbjN domain-containing protein [Magnetococcales bacterium]|nr:YbjN domain-containing protein [Magnetococcales bacterium]